MSIVNATIKQQVNSLIESTKIMKQADAQTAFAQGIADIIEAALKSAVVSVSVTTIGSATAQAGSGTGSLS